MSKRYELPSELNIYNVLEVRDALLAWVAQEGVQGHDYLELSARDVAEVDGAGLQVIAALSHMDQPWHLVQTSTLFADACRTIGLDQWLDKRFLKSEPGEDAA